MPRAPRLHHSDRLREVVADPARGIFRGMTQRQIAQRVQDRGGKCSQDTARQVQAGGVARVETMRAIGQAFAGELLRDWADEIAADLKQPAGPKAAVDWFLWISGKAEPIRAPVRRAVDERTRLLVRDVLEERAASEPAEYLWRRVCFASQGVAEPPPLPCPPGGWLGISFTEAESLAREYEAKCKG